MHTTFIPFAGVDVGYSHTKYVFEQSSGAEHHGSFQSLVGELNGRMPSTAGSGRRERVWFWPMSAARTLVTGPDTGNYMRKIAAEADSDFCLSDGYLCLYRTALHHIATEALSRTPSKTAHVTISRLVGGLPLTTLQKHREALKAKMLGVHVLPPQAGYAQEITVDVRAVSVIPQPEGALLYSVDADPDYKLEFGKSRNLVIDVGGGTTDWFRSTGNYGRAEDNVKIQK